jgi:hypothetical protein
MKLQILDQLYFNQNLMLEKNEFCPNFSNHPAYGTIFHRENTVQ